MGTTRYSDQQESKSRQNPRQVQPTENIGNLSASRRYIWVRTTVSFYCMLYVYMIITYSKSMDQPGKVADPARGQLNRENEYFPPRSRLRIWSRETGSAVPSPVSLLISILRLNLVLTYRIPPEFRGGVNLLFYTTIRHRVNPEFIGSRN